MLENIQLPLNSQIDAEENPIIHAHLTHSSGAEWWILSKDDHYPDLLFGVAKIIDTEMGTIPLKELQEIGAVLDSDWQTIGLYTQFPQFQRG